MRGNGKKSHKRSRAKKSAPAVPATVRCQTEGCNIHASHFINHAGRSIRLCHSCIMLIVIKAPEDRATSNAMTKPPLGLMPRRIWMEHRMKDLQGAITRATNPVKMREYSGELFDLVTTWEDAAPAPEQTKK